MTEYKKDSIVDVTDTLLQAEKIVDQTSKQLEETVIPIRQSILKRFPTLFLLLVTFGFTAVVTSMEQLLIRYDFLVEKPFLILLIGIGILAVTGRLYKKLG